MIRTLARPMLATVFVTSGVDALRHPGARATVAAPLLDRMIPLLGLPDDRELLVRANGEAMLGGGALLATGRLPRLAASVLAGSLVPATLAGHRFWERSDPAARAQDRNHVLKNLGLLGGLLLASVDTEGKPSVAWRARQWRLDRAARRAAEGAGS